MSKFSRRIDPLEQCRRGENQPSSPYANNSTINIILEFRTVICLKKLQKDSQLVRNRDLLVKICNLKYCNPNSILNIEYFVHTLQINNLFTEIGSVLRTVCQGSGSMVLGYRGCNSLQYNGPSVARSTFQRWKCRRRMATFITSRV